MTEISKDVLIDAAPADVAAVMFDPLRDTEWMTSVNTSEPQSPGITVGAEVRRTSVVAGADVAWTTVVEAFHFPHILRLTIGGGHTGAVKYEVQRSGTGSIARVRAASDKDLFGFDLDKLKALIEYP